MLIMGDIMDLEMRVFKQCEMKTFLSDEDFYCMICKMSYGSLNNDGIIYFFISTDLINKENI